MLFVAAYVAVVAVHLSLHGRTFTRIGSARVEIPDMLTSRAVEEETDVAAADLGVSLAELRASMTEIDVRLRALEHPRDLVLRSNRGDLA